MSTVSVITLTRNRNEHLLKLIEGLCRSDMRPCELIVVDMGNQLAPMPTTPFPLSRLLLPSASLPLAEARNRGARAARGEHLLFLDVDCIPRQNLLVTINKVLKEYDALICAEVRYLGPQDRHLVNDEQMLAAAIPHPVRDFAATGFRPEPNPGLFWSLTFGMRRASFMRLGGFDEEFVGYGAEDTDFGFRATNARFPLLFLGGTGSFHQYHDVYLPPIQHLADIVRNANRFYSKWHKWPMEAWLRSFEAMGLVQCNETWISQLRDASTSEIKACRQTGDVWF